MINLQMCARVILGAFLLTFSIAGFAEEWFEAARKGNLRVMESMLSKDSKLLDSKNEKGYTAFILATYHNQKDFSERLLALGANPCLTDNKGNTALMGVIFKGHDDVSLKLIDKCDVNHTNHEGQTALMYASLFGRERVAKKLLSSGARMDIRDHSGNSASDLAEGQFNQAMVGILKTFRIIK